MARNKLHISLIIGFTTLFAVFNIGLPVVLHYCEIMNTYSSSDCDMCHPETKEGGQLQYSKLQHSCCTSVVLANNNRVEFLQNQKNEVTTIIQQSITPIIQPLALDDPKYITQLFNLNRHSPPDVTDIPVLHSSLLI